MLLDLFNPFVCNAMDAEMLMNSFSDVPIRFGAEPIYVGWQQKRLK